MTDDGLPLAELMAKTGDGDFLRSVTAMIAIAVTTEGEREIVGLRTSARARPSRSGRPSCATSSAAGWKASSW